MTKFVENSAEGAIPGTESGGGAPELIENEGVLPTTSSDTYSFAALVLECITEKALFSEHPGDGPPRPDGQDPRKHVSGELWDLMVRCWSTKPDKRPKMQFVHSFFLQQT